MLKPFRRATSALVMACALLPISASSQQLDPRATIFITKSAQLGERFHPEADKLSSGLQRFFRTAQNVDDPGKLLEPEEEGTGGEGGPVLGGAKVRPPVPGPFSTLTPTLGPSGHMLSSPGVDFNISRFMGFIQNDSSVAWCGSSVVVGFQDFAAAAKRFSEISQGNFTLPNVGNGVAYSTNGGATFSRLPFLNPGNLPFSGPVGLPSVACADSRTFHYASFYGGVTPNSQLELGVSINTSHDGGKTWSDPLVAVGYTSGIEAADRPFLAIDPSNPNRLFITYVYLDGTFPNPTCGEIGSHWAIALIKSEDGGVTWSSPNLLADTCTVNNEFVTAPQIALAKNGTAYVGWLRISGDGREEIMLRRSLDHGNSFAPSTLVSDVVAAGNSGFLQGLVLGNENPSIAVDNSNGPNSGTVYVGWTDGRNRQVADVIGDTGTYNFGDAVFVKSSDLGMTWTGPKPTWASAKLARNDQYMTTLDVDRTGALALCYYDRARDPRNTLFDRTCSVSRDGGSHFDNIQLTDKPTSFNHLLTIDLSGAVITDYDRVSSDRSGANPGFFTGYVLETDGNTDVFGGRVK